MTSQTINIAVVGDVCLDIRRYGSSTRTSPEDPNCKVLTGLQTTYELGMAGNVAAWLAAEPECRVSLLGLVVGDEAGGRVLDLCRSRYIQPKFPNIWSKSHREGPYVTTVKERICLVQEGKIQQLVRCDVDMAYEMDALDLRCFTDELEMADLVVVADYEKGVFCGERGEQLRERIGGMDKTVVVNSKTPNLWEEYPVDALICNSREATIAWPDSRTHEDKFPHVKANYLIATQGCYGLTYFGTFMGVRESRSVTALSRNAVDVTGAGDAFTAGFALAYHCNSNGHEAIKLGQEWAARCVQTIGCGAPTRG